jgi:hypothetical protein
MSDITKPKGRCPFCNVDGIKSRVNVGGSMSTAMGANGYYDEEGKYHYHDPNKRSTEYSCSQGHRWIESRSSPCSHCDFGHEKPTVRQL